MFKKEGFWDVVPQIKSVSFPLRGKWQVDLVDGRSIIMPISAFPSLKRISSKERKNWYLIGGGVTWDDCSVDIFESGEYANPISVRIYRGMDGPAAASAYSVIAKFDSNIEEETFKTYFPTDAAESNCKIQIAFGSSSMEKLFLHCLLLYCFYVYLTFS